MTLDELIAKIEEMIENDDPQSEFERGWNSAINDITGGIIPDNRPALETSMKGEIGQRKCSGCDDTIYDQSYCDNCQRLLES